MRLARIVVAALTLVATPSILAAPCAGFTDVDSTSPFCTHVTWLKNRGITLGCTATLYCPTDYVTRLQMAVFLYRLGYQNAFLQNGNAFGTTARLGTTDGQPLEVVVGNSRAMRYEDATSPNVIGGHALNYVAPGTFGGTIGGGGAQDSGTSMNIVLGNFGTVGGGQANVAGKEATVAGGTLNQATGDWSTVGGGYDNVASGVDSTIIGGAFNRAVGQRSVAAGYNAVADQNGCFVFANWTGPDGGSCLGTANVARFMVNHGFSVDYFARRPDGGGMRWVYIGDLFSGQTIATWTGAFLSDAGVWVNAVSSREAKTEFARVDTQAMLEKVAALPITTWRYRDGEGKVRHIGPMAEDFHAAFDVGYGPRTIAGLDADGVALAAIQGLNAKLEARLAARDAEVAGLRAELAELRALLLQPSR